MSSIYYEPDEQQISIQLDGAHRPVAFHWRRGFYEIESIANAYTANDGTLIDPITREYFLVTLKIGVMVLIYHDFVQTRWGIEFSFD